MHVGIYYVQKKVQIKLHSNFLKQKLNLLK